MEIKSFGSICSGVGMQEMAYKRVFNDNIKYYAEIDKFAIKSYEAIHRDIKNLGDFTKAEDVEQVDFMFASTPCQDFSVAGKRKGFDGMRGTLTFEWVEMLKRLKEEGKLPKTIGFENVPGIISKKFLEGFNLFKLEIEKLGFNIFQGKLNAKHYGIPQNRDRVFLQGFQKETNFKFPKEIILVKKLKDMLESVVDEKFYLKKEKVDLFIENFVIFPEFELLKNQNISYCIDANYGKGTTIENFKKKSRRQLIQEDPKIIIAGHTDDAYEQNARVYDVDGLSPTLAARDYKDPKKIIKGKRIRKLTPLECWRLMGISDEDFYKAQKVNSNSQLYKQAGNGIVVDVLEAIFQAVKKCIVIEKEEVKYKYDVLSTGEKQYLIF